MVTGYSRGITSVVVALLLLAFPVSLYSAFPSSFDPVALLLFLPLCYIYKMKSIAVKRKFLVLKLLFARYLPSYKSESRPSSPPFGFLIIVRLEVLRGF